MKKQLLLLIWALPMIIFAQKAPLTTPQQAPSSIKAIPTVQDVQNMKWLQDGKYDDRRVGTTRVIIPQKAPRPVQTGTFGQDLMRSRIRQQDPRQLPLSPNGKLLSPEGYEVDFVVPRSNLQHGGCLTPVPMVNTNGSSRANCPVSVPCDSAVNRNAAIPAPGDPVKNFKLRWTVVGATAGNFPINQSGIDSLMSELNAHYAPWGIQFCTEGAHFVTNATLAAIDPFTEDFNLKTNLGDSSIQMINVYVVESIQLPGTPANQIIAGYAKFPYDSQGGTNIEGGIVLSAAGVPPGTFAMTHEMGHVFGLEHTFRGVSEVSNCTACYEAVTAADGSSANGDTEGDWCSDTNPHPVGTGQCFDPLTPNNSCDLFPWNNTPKDNFMSYSGCTNTFTSQQAGRMHCMIDSYLGSWVSYGNSFCNSLPPVAEFRGAPLRYVAPANITFTDESLSGFPITTWTWNFDVTNVGGGTVTPASFSGQTPPLINYTTPGLYTVSLTVSNANGSDSETKTAYIEILPPATDCDTLDSQWLLPTNNPFIYGFTTPPASGFLTGVPNNYNWSQTGIFSQNTNWYERFTAPTPGASEVGAVRLGIGGTIDSDSSMDIDVLVYNDDGFGAPDINSGPVGGIFNVNVRRLNLPNSFVVDIWLVFDTLVKPTTTNFHVGFEIDGFNTGDRLILESTTLNEGEMDASNHCGPTFYNYYTDDAIDFDLHIVPMIGEWPTQFIPTGFGQSPVCDTTYVLLTDTMFFNETLVNATFVLDDGRSIVVDSAADLDTILVAFTEPGPATGYVATVNDCGRVDTFNFSVSYLFNETPNPNFTIAQTNPVCLSIPGVDFTGTPVPAATIASYQWDFGDGTGAGPLTTNTVNKVYNSAGSYYVSLTVTDTAGCAGTEQKLNFISAVDCSVVAPTAGFSYSPLSACALQIVNFTDTSVATANPATSWLWSFGDGSFSTQQNPSHTYNSTGTFTVTLTAGNAGGSSSASTSITIANCPFATDILLSAQTLSEDVGLTWEIPTSGEGLYFAIERSVDGSMFERLESITGDLRQQYNYWDRGPGVKKLFYRIYVQDADGISAYSNTVEVLFDPSEALWAWVFPNPIGDQENLLVSTYLGHAGDLRLILRNAIGQAVLRKRIMNARGEHQEPLFVGKLPAGIYYLEVITDRAEKKVVKIVKK